MLEYTQSAVGTRLIVLVCLPAPAVGLQRKYLVEGVQIGSLNHRVQMLQVFLHCADSLRVCERIYEIVQCGLPRLCDPPSPLATPGIASHAA